MACWMWSSNDPGDAITTPPGVETPGYAYEISSRFERLETPMTRLDTVTLNIIHNALTNIASEMALVMLKTSYSTIFNEGLDFCTVLLDRNGDLIAEKN